MPYLGKRFLIKVSSYNCNWAADQTKLQVGMCLHQILRSACASAKSDQSSVIALWKARSSAILRRKTKTLIRMRGCTDWRECLLYAHGNLCLIPVHVHVRDTDLIIMAA